MLGWAQLKKKHCKRIVCWTGLVLSCGNLQPALGMEIMYTRTRLKLYNNNNQFECIWDLWHCHPNLTENTDRRAKIYYIHNSYTNQIDKLEFQINLSEDIFFCSVVFRSAGCPISGAPYSNQYTLITLDK